MTKTLKEEKIMKIRREGTLSLKKMTNVWKSAINATKCPICHKEMQIVFMYTCKKHGFVEDKL